MLLAALKCFLVVNIMYFSFFAISLLMPLLHVVLSNLSVRMSVNPFDVTVSLLRAYIS